MNEILKGEAQAPNIHQKLFKIFETITTIPKEDKGGKYKYVSSSDVLNKIRGLMIKERVMLIPQIVDKRYQIIVEKPETSATILTELDIQYTWVNIDDPQDIFIVSFYGQGVDISGEKGVGKALTYAEKYFLLKFFNIPTDEADPDDANNQFKNAIITQDGEKLKNPNPSNDLEIVDGLKNFNTISALTEYYNKNKEKISDRGNFNKMYAQRAKEIRGI